MTIEISKQEIFNEVEKRTSLEGSMIPERFDRVWASTYEGELLESYWIEGYTAVIQLLKRYLSSASVNYTLTSFDKDEKLTIEATMPARYNTLLDGSVATDVKMLIACNIISGWLGVKLPEAAAKYEEESKGYVEDLQLKLLFRKEPTNTAVAAEADSEDLSRTEVALTAAEDDAEKVKEEEVAISVADVDAEAVSRTEVSLSAADTDSEDMSKEEACICQARCDYEYIESSADEVIAPAKQDTEVLVQNRCECQNTRYIRNCCDGYCNW